MTSPAAKGRYNIRKGRSAENEMVAFLKERGFPMAERRRLSGNRDLGDIAGVPGLILDVKSRRHMDLAAAMDDLRKKIKVAKEDDLNATVRAVVFKRPRCAVGSWYAIMTMDDLAEIVERLLTAPRGVC